MRIVFLSLGTVVAVLAMSCGGFLEDQAIGTTAGVLVRAQPALNMESDYQLAHDAIPGALKTIEGFWIANPDKAEALVPLLTEGFCQYGTAFVEDDWEIATFAKKLDEIAYHNTRASHIFTRCLNYALRTLGTRWQKELFGTTDQVAKLVKDTSSDRRTAMMWVALALGSIINHNLNRVEMISYLPTVRLILDRVLAIDAQHEPHDKQMAALPHIALGMILTGASTQFGGDPKKAQAEFELALKITDNKMLLARALMGYRVGVMNNDRKFFHDQLKQVLETDPAVWPEQRLANEVAHRRARRYLSHEKEQF